MNEPTLLRRLAEALLSAALRIAPSDTLDWGNAMLSELRHVEGNWSAWFGLSAARACSPSTPSSQ